MINAGRRNGVYAPDAVIFKIARRIETKLKTAMTSRTRSRPGGGGRGDLPWPKNLKEKARFGADSRRTAKKTNPTPAGRTNPAEANGVTALGTLSNSIADARQRTPAPATIKPALRTPRHSACFLEANAPMTPQNPAHSAKPPIPARLNHSDVGH